MHNVNNYYYSDTGVHIHNHVCTCIHSVMWLSSNDFGVEVRDLFEVITNDALSPQLVNEIIAFRFGTQDYSGALDDFYSDFLLQQARWRCIQYNHDDL